MSPESDDNRSDQLEQRVFAGDVNSLAEFFELHRDRLARMVSLRMDRRVQGRVDPADVLQESYVEAAARLSSYVDDPQRMPLFLWLRALAHQKVLQLHRHHLGRQRRDAKLEVSMNHQAYSEATSAVLAANLIGEITTPSQAAIRAEMKLRIEESLETMEAIDREVLALRHFEHLSAAETAHVLEIDESAASKRYVRALKRLGKILRSVQPGGGNDTA